MSYSLILSLNDRIPRRFLGKEFLYYKENDSQYPTSFSEFPYELYIEDISCDVVRHRIFYGEIGRGYELPAYAYAFFRTCGSLFFWYNEPYDEVPLYTYNINDENKQAHKWIYDNIVELIDLGYEVALMNGNIHPNDPEEIFERLTLRAEELLKLETVLKLNVLYTIIK